MLFLFTRRQVARWACRCSGSLDEKFHETFMKDEDIPYFVKPKKSGWRFFYIGYGHDLKNYIGNFE